MWSSISAPSDPAVFLPLSSFTSLLTLPCSSNPLIHPVALVTNHCFLSFSVIVARTEECFWWSYPSCPRATWDSEKEEVLCVLISLGHGSRLFLFWLPLVTSSLHSSSYLLSLPLFIMYSQISVANVCSSACWGDIGPFLLQLELLRHLVLIKVRMMTCWVRMEQEATLSVPNGDVLRSQLAMGRFWTQRSLQQQNSCMEVVTGKRIP